MASATTTGRSDPGQVAVDDVDLGLIGELQADGRLSMRTLAERLHISRAGCYARVERLRRDGVITGFAATVDARRLGRTLSAHVYLKVRQHSWKDVREALREVPEIEHGYLVSGENDIVLFVRTRDAENLRELVLERLQTMDDVLSSNTALVFDEL
ncbi:MAG: Lrp/AsnC family transcriptional regulator [Actinobacteria bacterium]|nr:Lrp/AsnC family transcriptional regulator [Actinomycetota bacterium]